MDDLFVYFSRTGTHFLAADTETGTLVKNVLIMDPCEKEKKK